MSSGCEPRKPCGEKCAEKLVQALTFRLYSRRMHQLLSKMSGFSRCQLVSLHSLRTLRSDRRVLAVTGQLLAPCGHRPALQVHLHRRSQSGVGHRQGRGGVLPRIRFPTKPSRSVLNLKGRHGGIMSTSSTTMHLQKDIGKGKDYP